MRRFRKFNITSMYSLQSVKFQINTMKYDIGYWKYRFL